MAATLTSAVTPAVLSTSTDFATALGLFTSGRVTAEQFSTYQAEREAAVASKPAAKAGTGAKKAANVGLTRASFRQDAKPVALVINGQTYAAEVKEFSTGSLGWNLNGKITLKVGDTLVTCQCGVNLTVVGSKELA